MTVSDKMMDALLKGSDRTTRQATQAVVNAAWTEFDPDDESSWPDVNTWVWWEMKTETGTKIARQYLAYFALNDELATLISYADPQDLMFKGDE